MTVTITIIGHENQTNDGQTVKIFAEKIQNLYGLDIRIIAPSAINLKNLMGRGQDALAKAVKNYLREENSYVIMVGDLDNPASYTKRLGETNSLINQRQRVINDHKLKGRAFDCPIRWEIESWLLVDCLGICCFYLTKKRSRQFRQDSCRDKAMQDQRYSRLISKYQKGNTEVIVESEAGGKGVKEYLEKFSADILLSINPNLPRKNLKIERYREREAKEIAKNILVDRLTIRRNSSLEQFANLLKTCAPSQKN